MDIKIITKKICREELLEIAEQAYGDMAKGVVDLHKKILALGGELHADAEALLLENGSRQKDLWGFNIYPGKSRSERLEYSSLINIRPQQGNRSMALKNEDLCNQMKIIIDSLVE